MFHVPLGKTAFFRFWNGYTPQGHSRSEMEQGSF